MKNKIFMISFVVGFAVAGLFYLDKARTSCLDIGYHSFYLSISGEIYCISKENKYRPVVKVKK
ncbi:MAG: hypothetical protein ACN2B6_01210 [Rickettsiales bacterium]